MATAVTSVKRNANSALSFFDHDPADSTVATEIGWVDMRDYRTFRVVTFASALTGVGVTAFTIVANSDSAGGGTNATVIAHGVASAPDAVGDWLVLEVTAEQIREVEVLATHGQLRYVTAVITCANLADEQVVMYERDGARFAKAGLTADTIA